MKTVLLIAVAIIFSSASYGDESSYKERCLHLKPVKPKYAPGKMLTSLENCGEKCEVVFENEGAQGIAYEKFLNEQNRYNDCLRIERKVESQRKSELSNARVAAAKNQVVFDQETLETLEAIKACADSECRQRVVDSANQKSKDELEGQFYRVR